MRLARLFFGIAILLCALVPAHAQDYSKFLFNVGGGIGFPLGNLSNFVNDGGNFVIGGGYGFMKHVGVDTEFMWHDLPINDATKAHLQTPGASARQYSWTFNPIVHTQIGDRFGVYGIGGIGWYHRSGETTTPGVGVDLRSVLVVVVRVHDRQREHRYRQPKLKRIWREHRWGRHDTARRRSCEFLYRDQISPRWLQRAFLPTFFRSLLGFGCFDRSRKESRVAV